MPVTFWPTIASMARKFGSGSGAGARARCGITVRWWRRFAPPAATAWWMNWTGWLRNWNIWWLKTVARRRGADGYGANGGYDPAIGGAAQSPACRRQRGAFGSTGGDA